MSRAFNSTVLCAFLMIASPAVAADEAPLDAASARPVGPVLDKEEAIPEAGHDVEGGPIGEGAEFARITPIVEAEVNAADPHYRGWVERIRTGTADKRIMRLHAFYRNRLDPFDSKIAVDWREEPFRVLRDEAASRQAVARFEQGRNTAAPSRADSSATTRGVAGGISPHGVWKPVGPFTIPGRMTGLARPEGQPDTLYASAADGGLWRTKDAGSNWERLSDFEVTLSGGSVLIDPNDPNTIYFGTGEGNGAIDNYPGIGVLKSIDGGLTWSTSNTFSSSVRALTMHSVDSNRVYAAGSGGCYKSDDAGATFSLMPGMPGAGASDIVINPANPDIVYCSFWTNSTDGDIFKSVDRGDSWVDSSAGLPAPNATGRIALAISQSNPDVLIAGIDEDGGLIYRTTDGGDNWTATQLVGFCGGQCWYDIDVEIDPADSNRYYAAGVNTYMSGNAGGAWSLISSSSGGRGAPNYVHVDQHDVFSPAAGEVILANDGGIYRSMNYGQSWTEMSQGMDTTQYYGICRHPTDPGWAFGGTQDNGSHRRTPGANPEWDRVLGGDGGMCMSGPPGSNVVVGEFQNHNMQRSTNGGNNWSSANGGIGSGEPRPWVGIMTADPSDRNNMWTGTDRVYRSLDARASSWSDVSGELYGGNSVSAIEVSPSNSNFVWAGFSGGGLFLGSVALSANPNWRDSRVAGMPTRYVRRIRVDPDSFFIAYAVFGGFGSGKIWKTVDAGHNWTDQTGNLPDVPVNDLVIDADNPGTLLAATDLGVFRSDDDGTTWYGFSNGLPTVASIEFTHDRGQDRLRVGTHGRSMWEWQEAADGATPVADGATAGGTSMIVAKLSASDARIEWDALTCTARDHNLFYGDLDDVANRGYLGSECALGNSGRADLTLPTSPSGDLYFVLVATDGQGTEGPHGFDVSGQAVSADGIGSCGIAAQDPLATCP